MINKSLKIKMTFRAVEYHTIEREVGAEEFRKAQEGDVTHWLEEKLKNDSMPDSEISTDTFELDGWEVQP